MDKIKKSGTKKIVMGIAALFILAFHFWIPVTKASVIIKALYIGVDMFFFVSAWSLGKQSEINFFSFMKNRLDLVYFPFFVFALIALFYNGWKIERFLKVISGVELFEKGGGAFLWYLIASLFFYALTPVFVKLKAKLKWWGFAIMIGFWATFVCVLQFVSDYTKIFILLNRLPIFFTGLYFDDIQKSVGKNIRLIVSFVLLIAGSFLIYKFGTKLLLRKPIADFYYIVAIPFVVGLIELLDQLNNSIKYNFYILPFLGNITLEIYGLQMIFGYKLESLLLKSLGKDFSVLVFFITCAIIILCAFVMDLLFKLIRTSVQKLENHSMARK